MINIAHLYYDLLNLYGENGNIKILKKQLENQGIKVHIDLLSINDKIDFEKYDFIYIGAGTENNQKIVINHLLKYKKEIKKYIENNKFFLATGNSLDLFGKYIEYKNEKINMLSIFDFESIINKSRIVCESLFKCSFIKKPIIGFQNQSSTNNIDDSMFEVIKGIGKKEGIKYKHFYGTYLIGPLLVRNPEFLKYIIKELLKSKKLKKFDLLLEEKAYDEFVKNYY